MIFLSPTTFTWFLSQSKSVLVWQLHRLQLSLLDFLVELKTVCNVGNSISMIVNVGNSIGHSKPLMLRTLPAYRLHVYIMVAPDFTEQKSLKSNGYFLKIKKIRKLYLDTSIQPKI